MSKVRGLVVAIASVLAVTSVPALPASATTGAPPKVAAPAPVSAPQAASAPSGYWPFSSWDAFVAQQNTDLTGTPGTTTSRAATVAALTNGTTTAKAVIETRINSTWFSGNVAPVARLYWAYFGRIPDYTGMNYWTKKRRTGTGLSTISQGFANSSEFKRTYGTLSNRLFVALVYQNVLGRPGEASGITYWTGKLDNRTRTRGQVMTGFSESNEYIRKKAGDINVLFATAGLLGRSPKPEELPAATAMTVPDIIDNIRLSPEYGARLGLPGTGLPTAPTNVYASAGATNGQARVSWRDGNDNGAPILTYIIRPYAGGVAKPAVEIRVDGTSAIVTGLTNGVSHTFTVAARTVRGTGPASSPSNATTPVAGTSTHLSVGGRHACSTSAVGLVLCWGRYYGKNVEGTAVEVSTLKVPTGVTGLYGAVETASAARSCALVAPAGTVSCWVRTGSGISAAGAIGNLTGAKAIAGGGGSVTDTFCAVLTSGAVSCWGDNTYGQRGTGAGATNTSAAVVPGITGATSIAVANATTCAVVTGGAVKCWGFNGTGLLGNGGTTDSATPVTVSGVTGATALSGGLNHMCAVTGGGAVKCWGRNDYGQLGIGTTDTQIHTPVTTVGLTQATQVAAGTYFTCARRSTATVACWGRGHKGQVGDGALRLRPLPVEVSGLADAASVTASDESACAQRTNHTITCWGASAAELAVGVNPAGAPPGMRSVMTSDSAIDVTSGLEELPFAVNEPLSSASCSLGTLGVVRCWGATGFGLVGDGSNLSSPAAKAVPGVIGATRVEMSAAMTHACAILRTGKLMCWGIDDRGQMGDGTPFVGPEAAKFVPGVEGVTSVALGDRFTCAVGSHKNLYGDTTFGVTKCWGANDVGQLGDGTTTDRPTPTIVAGLGSAVQVTAGMDHACVAELVNGGVRCWGKNSQGQLGDGTTTNRQTAVAVSGLSAAVGASAGRSSTCAVLSGGTARCWGSGPIGDGTSTMRLTPVAVSGLSSVTAIDVAYSHACAIAAGTLRCWGSNSAGQLGDGTTDYRNTPYTVPGATNVTSVSVTSATTVVTLSSGTIRSMGSEQLERRNTAELVTGL
jgi:alpha-tubulin suppressor-like RCC1 family protein